MDEERDYRNITEYEEFLATTRAAVNRILNGILWLCIMTGPAIAIGIAIGIFSEVRYSMCLEISLFMLILALVHLALVRRFPKSEITGLFALFALDILLVHMNVGHVAINLTWFLVPILSILFCDKRLYLISYAVNIVMMTVATWLISVYEYPLRSGYDSAIAFFADTIGGYYIESVIVGAAGYALCNRAIKYFQDLLANIKTIKKHETGMNEQLNILDSMAEIYNNVNLIDFHKMTEQSLRAEGMPELDLDFEVYDHTNMTRKMMNNIVPDQLTAFTRFTDITSVQERLTNRKSITGEFVGRFGGWFRAQYITVEADKNHVPWRVIFTIQDIDNDKRREEHLVRIAMTDELTRLYNRRCYEEDIQEYKKRGLSENFGILSIDVNGLKTANDSKGHAAGDELIKGAADTLMLTVGARGKVYRTGGDEFIALVNSDSFEALKDQIKVRMKSFKGVLVDSLSMSVGYASIRDYPDAGIEELEKIADRQMYEDKSDFYRESGIDRRKR